MAQEKGVGNTSVLILKLLEEKDMYGYEMIETLAARSDDTFRLKAGTLYPILHGAGKDVFYFGDWIRQPGVAICSCNDGLRPVIFKLEATDLPAKLSYDPIPRKA